MKTVVWDWNGTLLDDVEVCIETVNAMLRQRNLPALESVDQYQNVFTFPVIDYYRRVGFDLERESFEALSEEYMRGYHERAVRCGLFADAEPGIKQLREQGVPSLILSASRQDHLRMQTRTMRLYGMVQRSDRNIRYLCQGEAERRAGVAEEKSAAGPGNDHDRGFPA